MVWFSYALHARVSKEYDLLNGGDNQIMWSCGLKKMP
jgi:hypothetical protein